MHYKKMKLFSRICLIGCIFLMGCGTLTKNSSKTNRTTELRNIIERTAPGSQIVYFPPEYAYPLPNPDRPNNSNYKPPFQRPDTILTGLNGSTATVSYHLDGHIKGFVMDCPPINEKSENYLLEELKTNDKQKERTANIEVHKTWRNGAVLIGFFIALAIYLKK